MRRLFETHLHTFRFKVSARESIDLFKRQFKRYNVQKCNFLSLPLDAIYGKIGPDQTDHIDNVRVAYFKQVFSPNGYAYAGLEYKGLDLSDKKAVAKELLRQVTEYKRLGYDGMKMYEAHPNMRAVLGYELDDEVYDLYYDYCEKEGIPITMHIANPEWMWDYDKVGEYWRSRGCWFDPAIYQSFDGLHQELLRMMKKHPKLRLALAHWGFVTSNKVVAEEFMSYPNTMLDITPGDYQPIDEDSEYWKAFIVKYQDRIFYGTDTYNFEYDKEEKWLKATGARPEFVIRFLSTKDQFEYNGHAYNGLNLDEEILDKIFYKNASKMLGEPKKLDLDYFINKCEELLKLEDEKSLEHYNLWCMKHDFETMKEKGELTYVKEF